MKVIVIGERAAAAELVGSLRERGLEAEAPEPAAAGGSEIARLAHELVHLERVLGAGAPDAVVLADAGDRALAAALAATKLLIPAAAVDSSGPNAGLLAQVVEGVPASGEEVAGWIRGRPTLLQP